MQYSSLSDRELLDRSFRDGDKLATIEIVRRQRDGRAVRLYPLGRKGAEDEGACPWIMGIEPDGMLAIHTGMPNRVLVLGKDDVRRWVVHVVYKMQEVVLRRAASGGSAPSIVMAVEAAATPGFDVLAEPCPHQSVIKVYLRPNDNVTWRLGIRGAHLLVKEILSAARTMGWSNEDLGFTDEEAEEVIFLLNPTGKG